MKARVQITMVLLGLLLFILVVLSGTQISPLHSVTDESLVLAQELASNNDTIANCRYGASPTANYQAPIIGDIGAGWYLDFTTFPPDTEPANDAEFVHMVMIYEDKVLIQTDPDKQCDCPDDYEYLGTYDVFPNLGNQFKNYLSENTGETFIVGNEMERYGQGESYPSTFVDAYHKVYHFIKKYDPTAQVAISALVQFTPNRQQYLNIVWDTYRERYGTQMPVDIWTMHLYVLPELRFDEASKQWVPNGIASTGLGTDPSLGKLESRGDKNACSSPDVYCVAEHDDITIFAQHIVAMRKWMKQHGQQNKPLLLTEFSVLYPYEQFPDGSCDWVRDEYGQCFTPSRVTSFMNESFDFLKSFKDLETGYPLDNYKLIQQWMWFSIFNETVGSASNIVTGDTSSELTMMGNNFKNYVAGEPLYKNLIADQIGDIVLATNGAASVTANISVDFANNGSEAIKSPFTVTFYRWPSLTGVIGSVAIDPVVYGCASHLYQAKIQWPDLGPGVHNFYAKIDSGNVIGEVPADDADNVVSGRVRVYQNDIKLPVITSSN